MLKTTVKSDVGKIVECLDKLKADIGRLTNEELIDLGARLNSFSKEAEAMSDEIKSWVKARLKHRPGEVRGDTFKAVLQVIPVTRLNSKALKEDDPVTWMKYARDDEDERVTYKPR